MRVSIRSSDARRARNLQDVLAAAGVEAVALVGPRQRQRLAPEDVAILDADPDVRPWALAEAQSLAQGVTRPGAIIAATDFGHPPDAHAGAFDGWLQRDAPPALIQRELARARRAHIARDELTLRRETSSLCGGSMPPANGAPGWRALFIGEPHPYFLALERALTAERGRLEAAFSSFMGFDFLHDDRFDAVVLNANADAATALSLCGALRRNARLHHLPTLMLSERMETDFAAAAIERGASILVDRQTSFSHATEWLFSMMRRGREDAAVESGLIAIRAAHTGTASLFTPAFMEAHVETVARAAALTGRPLTLVGLRIALAPGARAPDGPAWKRGVQQVAEICGRLVRTEDCAALMEDDLVIIALPGADSREARKTAARVASVTECTAFAAGDTAAGPITLEQSVVELAVGESGKALMARARSLHDTQGALA
ncbi:MAG: hypothetical protein NW200_00300 [Hyphomonadaceae bacterium]|nr:hypothetical protein [Hyphomonadaceae bacterium]